MTITKTELRKAMKGRTVMIPVALAEVDLKVSQAEALYLLETQSGELYVTVDSKTCNVSPNPNENFGPSCVEYLDD